MQRCSALLKYGHCDFMEEAVNTCEGCTNAMCLSRRSIKRQVEEQNELPFVDNKKELEDPLVSEDKKEEKLVILQGFLAAKEQDDKEEKASNDKESSTEPVKDKSSEEAKEEHEIDSPATAYVDGSYNAKTNTYGYGVVLMYKKDKFTFNGSGNNKDTAKIRNVAGELLGAMSAIKKAKDIGAKEVIICHDYEGISKWVTGEWGAKNKYTKGYRNYVKNCGIKIRFQKIKAHSGEQFNELADKLAKKAVGYY